MTRLHICNSLLSPAQATQLAVVHASQHCACDISLFLDAVQYMANGSACTGHATARLTPLQSITSPSKCFKKHLGMQG